MSNYTIELEELGKICGIRIEAEIEYSYSPGDSGSYWEPPEPPQLEIESVTVYEFESDTVELKRTDRPDWFKWLDEIVFSIVESDTKYRDEIEENHTYYEDDREHDDE